jgi:alkyl sulfatase BDS1-like metallo-beta-lactamase superfamily hydrolase
MSRTDLNDVMMGVTTMQKQIIAGKAKITGNTQKPGEFVFWLDNFDFWFPIVTP